MTSIEILSSPPTLPSLEDLKSPKNTDPLSITTQPSTPKSALYAQNGNLFDLIITRKIKLDGTLTRTYFLQILTSLEVLHSQGKFHGDLKLENIWLDEKFAARIADFDTNYLLEESKVIGKETEDYRALEVKEGCCNNPQAADVYSLGIILFMLKTGGNLPAYEKDTPDRKEFMNIFWRNQCRILGHNTKFFGYDFRRLFMRMTDPNPSKRPSLREIKESVYCSKNIHSKEELVVAMKKRLESNVVV